MGLLQLFTTVQPRTLLCVQEEPRSLHSNLVVLVRGHPVRREGEGLVLVAVAHSPQELDAAWSTGGRTRSVFITVREPKTTTVTVDQKQQQPWLKSW